MRSSHILALALGISGLATACGPDETGPDISPNVAFTPSCTFLVCSFTAGSSGVGSDVVAYRWDFGDGTGAETQSSTHSYASAGTYLVVLTITDDNGASFRIPQQVTVKAAPPGGSTVTDPAGTGQAAIGLSTSRLSICIAYPLIEPDCASSGQFDITNLGSGSLHWEPSSHPSWLSVSPTSGTAPSSGITVSVNRALLPIGINGYRPSSVDGWITISAEGASNSPQTVQVTVYIRYE